MPHVPHRGAEEGRLRLDPLHRVPHRDLLGHQRAALGAGGERGEGAAGTPPKRKPLCDPTAPIGILAWGWGGGGLSTAVCRLCPVWTSEHQIYGAEPHLDPF